MKQMKSFRIYLTPGRVPTAACWIAVLAGVVAIVASYCVMVIWVAEVPLSLRRPVAWGFVILGAAVSVFVAAGLSRRGIPLSRKVD